MKKEEKDYESETNIKNLKVYKNLKNKKYKLVKTCAKYASLLLVLISSFTIVPISIAKEASYMTNKKEIIAHDNKLKEYASQFDPDNTPSFEIILTVMNDIRSNTIYYNRDKSEMNEIDYYPRLVLNDENNIGVCRHMADEFTTIMNLIDPRFEAYNLAVQMHNEKKELVLCNISTPTIEENEENQDNPSNDTKDINDEKSTYSNDDNINDENSTYSSDDNIANKNNNIIDNKIDIINDIAKPIKDFSTNIEAGIKKVLRGDHEVSILKPIGEDYYLVIDVTNPSIGAISKGKIYMFNSHNYTLFEYKPYEQFVISVDDTFLGVNEAFISSYFQDLDIDELDKKYGLKQQNKILKKIRNNNKKN